jgi:hypothetical protein
MVVLFALMPNCCHDHSVIVFNFKKHDASRVSEGDQPVEVLVCCRCEADFRDCGYGFTRFVTDNAQDFVPFGA